jgi:Spy/CpxP family protein refolding chaperone
MKKYILSTLLLTSLLAPGALRAENTPDAPPPPPAESKGKGMRRGPDLTQEEKDKLRTAMDSIRDEADVKTSREALEAAMKSHRETVKAALLKKDPTLAPILEKLGDRFPMLRPGGPEGNPGKHRRGDKPE